MGYRFMLLGPIEIQVFTLLRPLGRKREKLWSEEEAACYAGACDRVLNI